MEGGITQLRRRIASARIGQGEIVTIISALLFVALSIGLKGFLTADNLLSLVQSVSILGILGLGMALAIIARGIDLAIVATMIMSVAWALGLANAGYPLVQALAIGALYAICLGALAGALIAYAEIPPIFATLALGSVVYGFSKLFLVPSDLVYVPAEAAWVRSIATGRIFGVPGSVIVFLAFAFLCFLFLQYTKPGRFLRAIGDNPLKARNTGIPMRPMIVLQYMLSSFSGFVAGMVTASLIGSITVRTINSTLMYDIILVVVLGGIGLSGGRGGVRNVLIGTLLIGILLNGMTIMNISYVMQNIVKGLILLIAIIMDSIVNPRDEQTAQQGDI